MQPRCVCGTTAYQGSGSSAMPSHASDRASHRGRQPAASRTPATRRPGRRHRQKTARCAAPTDSCAAPSAPSGAAIPAMSMRGHRTTGRDRAPDGADGAAHESVGAAQRGRFCRWSAAWPSRCWRCGWRPAGDHGGRAVAGVARHRAAAAAWYAVFRNHSEVHFWFTYRWLAFSVCLLLAALFAALAPPVAGARWAGWTWRRWLRAAGSASHCWRSRGRRCGGRSGDRPDKGVEVGVAVGLLTLGAGVALLWLLPAEATRRWRPRCSHGAADRAVCADHAEPQTHLGAARRDAFALLFTGALVLAAARLLGRDGWAATRRFLRACLRSPALLALVACVLAGVPPTRSPRTASCFWDSLNYWKDPRRRRRGARRADLGSSSSCCCRRRRILDDPGDPARPDRRRAHDSGLLSYMLAVACCMSRRRCWRWGTRLALAGGLDARLRGWRCRTASRWPPRGLAAVALLPRFLEPLLRNFMPDIGGVGIVVALLLAWARLLRASASGRRRPRHAWDRRAPGAGRGVVAARLRVPPLVRVRGPGLGVAAAMVLLALLRRPPPAADAPPCCATPPSPPPPPR